MDSFLNDHRRSHYWLDEVFELRCQGIAEWGWMMARIDDRWKDQWAGNNAQCDRYSTSPWGRDKMHVARRSACPSVQSPITVYTSHLDRRTGCCCSCESLFVQRYVTVEMQISTVTAVITPLNTLPTPDFLHVSHNGNSVPSRQDCLMDANDG